MRHLRLLIYAALLAGLALVLAASFVAAQGGDTPPAYMGFDDCSDCHRGLARDHAETVHSQALLAPDAEEAIVADFTQGEDVRSVQLPGESAARPFTLDDVAYVIGAGRYAQRFAVTGEDGALLVLPAEWNAVEGQWQPFTLAEAWPDPAYDFGTNCAYCHTTGLDSEALTWVDDGVQCEACHGPGENHVNLADELPRNASDEEVDALRAAIFNQPDPQMCGQCHTRGTDTATGRPYPTTYLPGGDLAAGYTPFPTDDTTHWWVTGHAAEPNMQYAEWLNSAHAHALEVLQTADNATDSCLTCHSGDYRYTEMVRGWFDEYNMDGTLPDSLTVQTASQGVICQTCHDPHNEAGGDFDFYLVNDTYALCAECHTTANYPGEGIHHPNVEIYEGQTLVEEVPGIPSGHFSAEDGPDCQTCHMPALPVSDGGESQGARYSHALIPVPLDAPAALADVAACTACHDNVTPAQVQTMVTDVQTNVSARLESAQAALSDASPDWVRLALAAVAGDGSRGLHNYGYTNALLGAAEAALAEQSAPAASEEEAAPEEGDAVNPLSESVALPIIGRVEGLTVVGATVGGVSFLVALFAGLALTLLTRGWRRWLGGGFLVVALALVVAALILIFPNRPTAQASGDDSYCVLCHTTSAQPLTLADGSVLRMAVDPSEIVNSVHGENSPTGRMGCLDCHGDSAFPHASVPTDLRQYRIEMSTICADCHQNDLAHYEQVRDRNIEVGCADCHSAHAVQPADALQILPEHVIDQIIEQRGLPTPTPVHTPALATQASAATTAPEEATEAVEPTLVPEEATEAPAEVMPTDTLEPTATEAVTEAPPTAAPTEAEATEAPAAEAETSTASAPASAEISGPLDYQTLQPVLQAACGECHGEDSPRAGLTLTTYAGIIAGDRGGTVVEPGDPDNSYILEVQSEPHDANLSAQQLQFLTDWIAAGAPEFANGTN